MNQSREVQGEHVIRIHETLIGAMAGYVRSMNDDEEISQASMMAGLQVFCHDVISRWAEQTEQPFDQLMDRFALTLVKVGNEQGPIEGGGAVFI